MCLFLEVDFGSSDDSHCPPMSTAVITICATSLLPAKPELRYRFRYFPDLAIFFGAVRYIVSKRVPMRVALPNSFFCNYDEKSNFTPDSSCGCLLRLGFPMASVSLFCGSQNAKRDRHRR